MFRAMVNKIELVSNLIIHYIIFKTLYLQPTIVYKNKDELKGQLI
jgi:hypothetical protein